MGDRANVCIRDGKEEVWLYTHWRGYHLAPDVRKAMARGRGRWTDAPYLARIIFCEMVKGQELEETGFGIWTRPLDNEHELLIVDVSKQKVETYGYSRMSHLPAGKPRFSVSFQEFVDGALTPEEKIK